MAPGTCPEFLFAVDPELFSSLVPFSEKNGADGSGDEAQLAECSPMVQVALGFEPYHVKLGTVTHSCNPGTREDLRGGGHRIRNSRLSLAAL